MLDNLLNIPLGKLLALFIDKFNSYGWGLLAFTVATRIVMLPLGLLQQRSTINQMKVRPLEEAIRRQCGADKMKANLEVSELYKEHGVSATAGCLPLLIQFPLIIALYKIIRMPLTYIVGLASDQIAAIDAALGLNLLAAKRVSATAEIVIAEKLFNNMPAMVDAGLVDPGIRTFSYHFLGINLAETPRFALNALLFIPIFAGLTAFIQSWYQMKSTPPAPSAEGMQKQMLFTMPLLSVWIAFSMPSGMGLYWGFSSILALIQSILLNAVWNPKKTLERAYAQAEARAELEKQERLARRKANLGGVKAGQALGAGDAEASVLSGDAAKLLEEQKAEQQAAKERREKNYAKTLKFRSHIPDHLDRDLPPTSKDSKGEDQE
ncbi:MAG: YidC/Oxa1 family membrane protein insertase [Clostridia bacterium]|nr:YidC/Oxa1 family membrane protein insertase [Clostridia bacterium]